MTKTTRSEQFVRRLYENVGGVISGTLPDTHGIKRVFWGTVAFEIFTRLHLSYLQRSEGGTDALGNKFIPLKKSTIAQRPIRRGELSKFGLTKKGSGISIGDRTRGLLSPREDMMWKGIYSKILRTLILTLDEKTAKQIAAKQAWAIIKNKGAKTKLDTLGSRDVLIMRITDSIFDSLEPSKSSGSGYRVRKDQLFSVAGGTGFFGTLIDYAKFHNNTRPVIPDEIDQWINESVSLGFKAVFKHIENNVL